MQWEEVPQEHRNGEIQGYRVLYSDPNGPEQVETVHVPTKEISLTDLKMPTAYIIKVLAFTSVGDGPASSGISVTTAEDSKWGGADIRLWGNNQGKEQLKKERFS